MISRMKEICNKEYNNFLSLPNVNGVAIGNKIINGVDIGVPCLKVLVETKLYSSNLSPFDLVPKFYDGFITDVVEVGKIEAFGNTTKIRPAVGGISIGVVNTNTVGTLGCLVSTGAGTGLVTYILSNNHVMALSNAAAIGSSILQPGPGDGGSNPTDIIANLSAFVPINFTSGSTNIIDAAIAKVIDISLVSSNILNIGAPTGIASALIGDFVQKSGRTTGYTTGSIIGINATANVSYSSTQTATFINQIITSPISSAGDSGSIVLDNQNRVLGLLFAGSTSVTVLNDIRPVLKAFNSRLV